MQYHSCAVFFSIRRINFMNARDILARKDFVIDWTKLSTSSYITSDTDNRASIRYRKVLRQHFSQDLNRIYIACRRVVLYQVCTPFRELLKKNCCYWDIIKIHYKFKIPFTIQNYTTCNKKSDPWLNGILGA